MIWSSLNKKVSWTTFIAIIMIIIGVFAYFNSSDSRIDAKADSLQTQLTSHERDMNDKFASIKEDLASIKTALSIKNGK